MEGTGLEHKLGGKLRPMVDVVNTNTAMALAFQHSTCGSNVGSMDMNLAKTRLMSDESGWLRPSRPGTG